MTNLTIDGRKKHTTFINAEGYELHVTKAGKGLYNTTCFNKSGYNVSLVSKDEALQVAQNFMSDVTKKDTKKMTNKAKVNVTIDDKTLERVEGIKAKAKAQNNIVMLSNTKKLGVKSWSLQALNTCPASIDSEGNLVDACSGCYATYGNYRFNSVKATREYNKQVWQDENFVSDFVEKLDTERYFRWFDSGDLYSLALAKKVYEIMKHTPHVKHWLPTRMYKFAKFHDILQKMQSLPNVVIRLSSDDITGKKVNSDLIETSSTILPSELIEGYNGFVCPAYAQDGRCLSCKACYNKDVKTVTYIAHGVVMKSKIKKLDLVNI